MRWKPIASALTVAGLLLGCAQTPREPVMRPIPPPPPTPPPGVVIAPGTAVVSTFAPPVATAPATNIGSTNLGSFEVTSNYVANPSAPPGVQPGTQVVPQYELVPPRPGANYVWRNGYWRWEGAWAWVPGEWVYEPPSVFIVPSPGFYPDSGFYYYHHFGGPSRYRRGFPRHRHWR